MKAIKQRFHQQIVRKYKFNYFATVRKEILEFQQFQALYNKILDNNQDLNILIQRLGFIVFYKHINQILDQKLYAKLYQNQSYFISNLNFIANLLDCQILPTDKTDMVIVGLSQILTKYKNKITALNIKQIFQILEKILLTQKYIDSSLKCLQNQRLILNLYQIIIQKQMDEYFFKIIQFCKRISNQKITQINDKTLINCLQIHIMTSNKVQELYVSYSFLTELFQKIYTKDQQIFQYGSILDKMMKDIFIDSLIVPISFFFAKALKNQSLLKLTIEMNLIEVIFQVIKNVLFKSNISVYGHQSVWRIFKNIVKFLRKSNNIQPLNNLNWSSLRKSLQNPKGIRHPYIKFEIFQFLQQICKTNVQNLLFDLLVVYEFQIKNSLHQFQQINI